MVIAATILLQALVVLLIARIVPGVRVKGFGSALGVAVVYGLLQWALKGALTFFTLPLVVVTLGAFLLVLNGFLLWVTDKLLKSFEIRGFPSLAMATLGLTLGCLGVDVVVGRLFG